MSHQPCSIHISLRRSLEFARISNHSHSLQKPCRRSQQRSNPHAPQYGGPFEIIDAARFPIGDTEARADDADDAEGCEEDPSGLTTYAVAEEDEDVRDECEWVDDQFGYGEVLVGSHYVGSRYWCF